MTAERLVPVSAPVSAPAAGPAARWTLFAASFGFLMVSLDATIVNVALPTLGGELGAGLSQLQWIVDGYALTFAAMQPAGGSLSDRLGARSAFTLGLGLFVLASLACGLAPSPALLIAARFVQGAGAAVQLPASLAMIRHAYPDGAARNRAVGVWAAAGGGAVVPAMSSAVLEAVEPAYAGVASAELNTARQVGGAVGVALFGTLIAGGFVPGLRLSLLIGAAALLCGCAVAARWVRVRG
ncbi:MFS transporter [Streptomyces hoynatensis]|uniref:MFS transporter n=1 Tax=Streptomyces hoynatensis TaxID=1141874 RepID=A0A3A9Z9S1_9ACTN|nr:MFS transporter [Streptomyces hoynatensis]RKN44995.1 MFS transporter [Streptomyces hoynatensis]